MKSIIKRDGTKEKFDTQKIFNAISKAFYACGYDNIYIKDFFNRRPEFTKRISELENLDNITVEKVQDEVEKLLMSEDPTVAKEYILYRKQRENIRNSKSSLNKLFTQILESEDSDMSRENANINALAPMGKMLFFGSETEKDFVKRFLISPKFVDLHDRGYFHIHDLNFYSITFNCCSIEPSKLLERGFSTGDGTIRQPQSIQAMMSLMAIILQSNQNDMFGGQAFPMFDYNAVPYIIKSFIKNLKTCISVILGFEPNFTEFAENLEKLSKEYNSLMCDEVREKLAIEVYKFVGDKTNNIISQAVKMTNKDTYQACESFIHNMNSLHCRSGAQVPFSSVNYGTCTSPEGRMLINNMLDATDAGLGHGETPIFPIQIFKVKEGVNALENDTNYDLYQKACRITAKRFYPNFVNIDAPFNLQYYVKGKPETEMATMGCVTYDSYIRVLRPASNDCPAKTIVVKIGEFIEEKYFNLGYTMVYDSNASRYVNIINTIVNDVTDKWLYVEFDHNNRIIMTLDHHLPIVNKGRTIATDLKIGDVIDSEFRNKITQIVSLNLKCKSYCLETETDRFDVNDINSHNCRTRTIGQLDGTGSVANRGNIAFTTMNLPRIAILSQHNETKFYELLDVLIQDTIDELLERLKYISKKKVCNFPFLMGQGLYKGSEDLLMGDTIESALKNGTLGVGFVGLAECLCALYGKHHGEDHIVYEKGLSIVKHIDEKCKEATKKYGWLFSCFATPAESTASRFLKIDRKEFGIIKGVTDKEFYTNSFHIPVDFKITAFDKMSLEGQFHEYCPGGAISYVELDGDATKNSSVVQKLVDFSRKCGISYFSINTIHDVCPVCGYDGIINSDVCPSCGWKEGTDINIEEFEKKGFVIK